MKTPRRKLLAMPMEKRALLALRAAVRKVIKENARLGLPIYVWQDGKVVALDARKLVKRSRRRRASKRPA